MNTKRIARFIILVFLLVPVGAELALRGIFYSLIGQAAPESKTTNDIAPAYADATFDVRAFLHEREQVFKQEYLDDDGIFVNPDYSGTYINIRNKHRVTTDQPANAAHTIYLFGSSSIWNIEVPDRYTIASVLQRRIGSALKVENMGIHAIDAQKQLRILKKTPIRSGDIVVFYDGFIDAIMTPRTITQNRAASGICPWLLKRVPWSVLILVACNLDTAPSQSLINEGYHDYRAAIVQAHDYAISHGATFYHFIQPTIYAATPHPFEASLAFDYALYERTWSALRTVPYTVDQSDILNGLRQNGKPLFFDEIHVNQYGDVVIADALYTALFVF